MGVKCLCVQKYYRLAVIFLTQQQYGHDKLHIPCLCKMLSTRTRRSTVEQYLNKKASIR